jgi:putative transposase
VVVDRSSAERARGRRPDHGHERTGHCAPLRPGSQYISLAFTRRLDEAGIAASMGGVGSAYDNASAESLFATIKRELVQRHRYPTSASVRTVVFDFVEVSTIGSAGTRASGCSRRWSSKGVPRGAGRGHGCLTAECPRKRVKTIPTELATPRVTALA